jgi:hypothetical protein
MAMRKIRTFLVTVSFSLLILNVHAQVETQPEKQNIQGFSEDVVEPQYNDGRYPN